MSALPAGLAPAAAAHRVAGCVYRSLSAAAGRGPVVDQLGAQYAWTLASHMQSLADLRAAGAVLDRAGIPWLVVKGPVLAERYYPDPGLRSYFDLDLIVQPRHLSRAIGALEAGGCELLDQGWVSTRRTLSVEVELVLPNGTRGDLHWHLLNDTALRRAVSLPMAEIFDRARPVTLGSGLVARTLDPEDAFIHLALHAVVSGANRLVWMKDIEQAALLQPDWGVVIDRVRAAGLVGPVGTILARTRETLGSPIPEPVLRHLGMSRAWATLARAGDTLSDFADPKLSAPNSVVIRSTHPGLASSIGQLLSRVGRGVMRRAWSLLRHGGTTQRKDQHRLVRLEGRTGQRIRAAYCDAVERFTQDLAS